MTMTRSTPTTQTTPTVLPATVADLRDLGHIIARAFQEDPVMCWITPDPERRAAIAPALFELYAEVFVPLGETYITEQLDGAALWAPPGQQPVGEDDIEAFAQRVAELAGEDAERIFELEAAFDAHAPSTPHFHLQLVGTLPERQGQGIGSALMEGVLARCDRDGVPAYLEATSEQNRRLYERHGFVATGSIIPAGGPTITAMWRDAA
jgi:GNAT superfamily N-acetyltransferase